MPCARFDAGCSSGDSPTLAPVKRLRAPPPLPVPLPALADLPRLPESLVPLASAPQHCHGASCVSAGASTSSCSSALPAAENGNGSLAALPAPRAAVDSSDWRMVLYHDQNLILYNPGAQPQFRSRRMSLEEMPGGGGELSTSTSGRCPLCRQTIDARFAFAAQAYFDLLQRTYRSSSNSSTAVESAEMELDVISEVDLYRILGVSRNARGDDIKRAYRKRSLRYHPDKNLADPEAKLKFQKIAEAFSVLSDENKRMKYDQSGDMDLEDFDVEQFMDWSFKYQKTGETDAEDGDGDHAADSVEASRDHNPFLLAEANLHPKNTKELPSTLTTTAGVKGCAPTGTTSSSAAEMTVMASEGGAEAEAAAVAGLRHLPPGLLNTGYYTRFFVEIRPLGSGSFGTVFLCRHVLDDLALGDYAVKKVAVGDDKAWLRDMVREVKTFERLHHPNVVNYKHSWLELSRSSLFCPLVPFLFILMQYCNGGSLGELIWHEGDPARPKPALPISHIWQLLLDILLGLQHLHRQAILHRDLKPTNILLQLPDGGQTQSGSSGAGACPSALLSDFGTATPVGEVSFGAASRGYTGTVEYTAPELLRGDAREYTEKSDMWSLGIVLYCMCFSTLLFSHEDPHVIKDLVRRFVDERHSVAHDGTDWLPPEPGVRLGPLRHVTTALLNVDADRRPATTDLLENPVFRSQASKHSRRGDHPALPNR
eukprot:TRINITY_DN30459_c0_g1_i1.p1 TRINITY_DN30459_c0_g1~~TRINITY_DN30459_c0_g1_i1.p1  ORF type:complete len:757 (+),score=129.41 TRINITY_DN30459_c0_g1_i1:143-2272(+)